MELNAEQIKKALECCANGGWCIRDGCPLYKEDEFGDIEKCTSELSKNALALIKELTEENDAWQKRLISTEEKADKAYYDLACEVEDLRAENERLKSLCEAKDDIINKIVANSEEIGIVAIRAISETEADTVRKMHSEIKKRCIEGGIYPAFVASTIDQIAKEMLGEKNET